MDIFKQHATVDLGSFVFLILANIANGNTLWLHCGIYGKTLEY